jgi:hypothetical protein
LGSLIHERGSDSKSEEIQIFTEAPQGGSKFFRDQTMFVGTDIKKKIGTP